MSALQGLIINDWGLNKRQVCENILRNLFEMLMRTSENWHARLITITFQMKLWALRDTFLHLWCKESWSSDHHFRLILRERIRGRERVRDRWRHSDWKIAYVCKTWYPGSCLSPVTVFSIYLLVFNTLTRGRWKGSTDARRCATIHAIHLVHESFCASVSTCWLPVSVPSVGGGKTTALHEGVRSMLRKDAQFQVQPWSTSLSSSAC